MITIGTQNTAVMHWLIRLCFISVDQTTSEEMWFEVVRQELSHMSWKLSWMKMKTKTWTRIPPPPERMLIHKCNLRNIVFFCQLFYFYHKNKCGYSIEQPYSADSNEYLQPNVSRATEIRIYQLYPRSVAMVLFNIFLLSKVSLKMYMYKYETLIMDLK